MCIVQFHERDYLTAVFDVTKRVFVADNKIVLEHPEGLSRVLLCYKDADCKILQRSKIELIEKTCCGLFTKVGPGDYIECIFQEEAFLQCNKYNATKRKFSHYCSEERTLELLTDFIDEYESHVKECENSSFARIGSLQEWLFPHGKKNE